MASLQIGRPQQHSQLGAMGVVEPKKKSLGECQGCIDSFNYAKG